MRFSKALGESSHLNDVYYPQLMRALIVTNVPTVMSIMMSIGRPLMSKKTLEKQKFCGGKKLGDINKCPFVAKHKNDIDCIPDFLGGPTPCPFYLKLDS